jgi:hypothetical protein
MKWNVHIISSKRDKNSKAGVGSKSCHTTGNALDLCVTHFDETGKVKEYVKGGSSQPELYKVIDILCSLHRDEIHEILGEFYSTDEFMKNRNNFAMIHFSDKHNVEGHGDHTKFLCQLHRNDKLIKGETKKYTRINNEHDKAWFNANVPKAFFEIAKKFYHALGAATFKREFGNYGKSSGYTDEELNALFGSPVTDVDKNAVASNLNGASLHNISYVRNRLKSEFGITDIQFCGIAGNFVQESSFYPTAEEYRDKPNEGGKGLAQWTKGRRVAAEKWLGMPIIKAPLSRQVDYLIYELETTEKSTIPAIKETNTVSDAVMAFEKNFERAGEPAYGNRIKYGNLVKKYIESGQIS